MDPKEILQVYHRALASGRYTLEQVNADIGIQTGGKYKTYAALAEAAFGVKEAEEELDAAVRVSERQPGIPGLVGSALIDKFLGGQGVPDIDVARGVGDFATSMRHGGTFGFDDEIIGAIAGEPARDRARQHMADLRMTEPVGTALGEIAGGVAVPVGVGGAAARGGAGMLARTGRAAGAGAGAGAVAGGLFGAGEAEGGLAERAPAAAVGATTGGVFGAALGAAGPPLGRLLGRYVPRIFGRKRGQRMARDIRRGAGFERSLDEAFEAADALKARVSEELYGPIDDAFEAVTDPGVLEALQLPELRTIVRSVSKDVASGKRAPSFRELQIIRNKARGAKGRSPEIGFAGDELSDEMQLAIPDLKSVDKEFARAAEVIEALEEARTFITKPSAVTRRAMAEYGEEGQVAFREGLIQELAQRLESKEGASPAMVKNILEAGPEMQQRLRLGFPTDDAFEEFMLLVATEKTALGFTRKAKVFVRYLIGGAIAYELLN